MCNLHPMSSEPSSILEFMADSSPHAQVCHVAAQYGQTAFLYHMALRWDADIDEPDIDGRTPLHWAAYKGFADTLRLLLVMDAQWSRPDREVSNTC